MKAEEIQLLAKSCKAELVETHISWVLLTTKYAYKIKKPIKNNFLDYSSLVKRKKLCEKEVEMNKKLSPEVYLGVALIKQTSKGFSFVKNGKVAYEYAVKMKLLKSAKQLDRMLEEGRVKKKHVKKLAQVIAGFHVKSKSVQRVKPKSELIKDFNDISTLEKGLLTESNRLKIQKLMIQVGEFLNQNFNVFKERSQKGFIKDCHGDLHTGNIFLYDPPILFDRIEFNDRFRYIDILQELGFICMDLEVRGYKEWSKKLLKLYCDFSDIKLSQEEKLLLNYYKCYTANVRAKVTLLKNTKTKKEIKMAQKYIRAMFKYSKALGDVNKNAG
jgi:aminoglycoside phosphotransferase family enzyme